MSQNCVGVAGAPRSGMSASGLCTTDAVRRTCFNSDVAPAVSIPDGPDDSASELALIRLGAEIEKEDNRPSHANQPAPSRPPISRAEIYLAPEAALCIGDSVGAWAELGIGRVLDAWLRSDQNVGDWFSIKFNHPRHVHQSGVTTTTTGRQKTDWDGCEYPVETASVSHLLSFHYWLFNPSGPLQSRHLGRFPFRDGGQPAEESHVDVSALDRDSIERARDQDVNQHWSWRHGSENNIRAGRRHSNRRWSSAWNCRL